MKQAEKAETEKMAMELYKHKTEAFQEDTFDLNETVDPWITDMTVEQASLIRAWVQKLKENDPASTIR
eukprot:8574942-Heterocapsa_arctica.AAC.1